MKKIKKGDIVGRKSYGKDIIFTVDRIIKTKDKEIAILKGITIRIEANSEVEDLELIEEKTIQEHVRNFEQRVIKRIEKQEKLLKQNNYPFREKLVIYTGRILHIDGDRRYAEKSHKYYKKLQLNAIVKNIPERKQPILIPNMLQRYNPDILVLTGHDGMIKKGTQFNNIYNYRNSRYFIKAVEQARKQSLKKDLVIFAGACQSYYEGLMMAGSNFASSPARILIDFMDPLIVAEKIATTKEEKYVTIQDIQQELRDGTRGVSGIRRTRKKENINDLTKNIIIK